MAFLPFCFCDHAQLCALTSTRALTGVSCPIYPIPWCFSVNLPCSPLLGAMHHRYCWARRVLALSSPVPAYLGSRRNAEPLAMWGLRTSEAPMSESARFTLLQDLSAAFARLVGIAAPGIVTVQSHRSHSSGFFWRSGLIVTADEALSEEGDVAVTLAGGESIAARLVGRDPTTDIALLRLDRSDLPPIRLESPPIPLGALAIAVGAEDGAPTAALSIVPRSTGPWWSLRSGEIDARIELDLRMRQSAEGGLAT